MEEKVRAVGGRITYVKQDSEVAFVFKNQAIGMLHIEGVEVVNKNGVGGCPHEPSVEMFFSSEAIDGLFGFKLSQHKGSVIVELSRNTFPVELAHGYINLKGF